MDIKKLGLAKIGEYVAGDLEEFWDSFEKYLIDLINGGQRPKDGLAVILSNNRERFAKRGWVMCQKTSGYFPKECCREYYYSYPYYLNKEKFHMLKYFFNGGGYTLYKDEILGEHFFDGSAVVLDRDFKEIRVCKSHLDYKIKSGEWMTSQYRRNGRVTTTFRTNFYGHGQGPRDWAPPAGDSIGMENEILFPSMEDKLRFSAWVGENYPGWICEYDGSLEDHGNAGNGGCELISPPLMLADLQKQATAISAKALEYGAKGHGAGTFYGMHVTVQLPAKNYKEVGSKLICLINNPKLANFWQICARRKGESFMTYSPFQNVRMETCFITERGRDEQGANRHRRAVYVRDNNRLLEIRIFRANLRGVTIRATLELCSLALNFCKEAKNTESVTEFKNYLEANASEELLAFCYDKKAMRELINAAYEETGHRFKKYDWVG